jgi:hypothetical protein
MTTNELEGVLKNSDCLRKFHQSDFSKVYKLKSFLNVTLDHLIVDDHIDKVSLVEFLTVEKDRIPLFIESQFGIHPKLEELFIDEEDRLVAIIHKARYSFYVFKLTIYRYIAGKSRREVVKVFDNIRDIFIVKESKKQD